MNPEELIQFRTGLGISQAMLARVTKIPAYRIWRFEEGTLKALTIEEEAELRKWMTLLPHMKFADVMKLSRDSADEPALALAGKE